MKRLIISPTDSTPGVDLNPKDLSLQFNGMSRPENVGLFYQQIIDWIARLAAEIETYAPATISLIFKLDYCNSSSQKFILVVLEKLCELKTKGLDLYVEWYYEDGDDKMLEDGEDMADAMNLNFNFRTL